MINGFFALVLAFVFVGGPLIIRCAIRNDNLAALENLDDDNLAVEAADAWERGEW